MPRKLSLLILFALAILFAWSPGLTRASAEVRAVDSFGKAWEFVADGCGTNCQGCGAVSSQRLPFGALVTIEYACGLIPADRPESHQQVTGFVLPLGTLHGLPAP